MIKYFKTFLIVLLIIFYSAPAVSDGEKFQLFGGLNFGLDKYSIFGSSFGVAVEKDGRIGKLKFTRVQVLNDLKTTETGDCYFFGFVTSREKCVHNGYSVGETTFLYGWHKPAKKIFVSLGPSFSTYDGRISKSKGSSSIGISFSAIKYFSKVQYKYLKFGLSISGTYNRTRSFLTIGANFLVFK